MSHFSQTVEGKTMQDLVKGFCKEWCSKKSEMEEMEHELISLIAGVQTLYISANLKDSSMTGKNLHSEYDTIINEIKDLKNQMKFIKDSEDTLKIAFEQGQAELREQFEKSSKPRKKADYGPFSSKLAKEYAEEQGVDSKDIEGSGKNNKITKNDIKKHISGSSASAKSTKKKTKKFCNGAKETGSPCKNSGSLLIKGKWYCKRHQKQAVNEVVEEVVEEEYSDYDESNDNPLEDDALRRFRNESLKSIDDMDEEDHDLNELTDDYKE